MSPCYKRTFKDDDHDNYDNDDDHDNFGNDDHDNFDNDDDHDNYDRDDDHHDVDKSFIPTNAIQFPFHVPNYV